MASSEQPKVAALHPVFRIACAWNACFLLLDLAVFASTGVRFDRVAALFVLAGVGIVGFFLSVGAVYRVLRPEAYISETSLAAGHVLMATQLAGLFSVLAVCLAPPLIDAHLAAVDAALGLHAPTISVYVRGIPWFFTIVSWCYNFFVPQILLSVLVLGLVLGDLEALWSYVFYYCFAATITIACFAVMQAEGSASWYPDYPKNVMLVKYLEAFRLLRDGANVVGRDQMQGFVTFPSFHAASGYAALAAFSQHPRLWWPLLAINAALVLGTVVVGGHFVIDSLTSLPICIAGIFVYRRIASS